MPAFDASNRQYGIRPAPDVVALLEQEAARLRTPPTTLATRLLEQVVRTRLGPGEPEQQQPDLAISGALLRELMTRVHFTVLLLGSPLPSDKREAFYRQAVEATARLLEPRRGDQ